MSRYKRDVGKTALVLAGGGLTGAVYEIGALRAIDDLLLDRTVNDFDIYVGTSAGALVAAMLANGLSPETMLSVMDGSHPEIAPIERKDLFSMNRRDLMRWGIHLPEKLLTAASHYARHFTDMSLFDVLMSLTENLPAGLYDGLALEKFVREVLTNNERANQFPDLARELYIVATDLHSGERVIFSRDQREDVSISMAVAASSAVPILYKPVCIGDKEYVDGGLRGNASLDLAIEHGATLVVCINPMVPYESSDPTSGLTPATEGGSFSERGIQAVANQTLRIVTHAGLHYHIKQLRKMHPEVDIILIEPSPEDYQMFFYNIMHYSARLIVARHGFESATLNLAEDYPLYKQVLARHGIPITRRLVIEEIAEIQQSDYDPEVIRRVLEARSSRCGQSKANDPICELTRTLAILEFALETIEFEAPPL